MVNLNKEKNTLKVYYDGNCGLCKTSMHILKTFFCIKDLSITPARDEPEREKEMTNNNSWIVIDRSGKQHFRYDAFLIVLRSSPVFRIVYPILSFTPIRRIGDAVYRYIASHRRTTCKNNEENK